MNRAAIVICGAGQVIQIHQGYLAIGSGDVAVRGEAAYPIMNGRTSGCVINVDELVRTEIRIEGHSEQSSFAIGVDRQRNKRRREKRAILNDPELAGFDTNEEPSVVREGHRGRGPAEIASKLCFRKTCRQGRGSKMKRSKDENQDGVVKPATNKHSHNPLFFPRFSSTLCAAPSN